MAAPAVIGTILLPRTTLRVLPCTASPLRTPIGLAAAAAWMHFWRPVVTSTALLAFGATNVQPAIVASATMVMSSPGSNRAMHWLARAMTYAPFPFRAATAADSD